MMARTPLFQALLTLVVALPLPAWCNTETLSSATPDTGSLLKMGLMLVMVLLMFVAFAWVMKRISGLNPRGSDSMKVSGGISLGQRERLVIVEVEHQRLLLGVTSQNIQLIKELPSSKEIFDAAYKQAMPEKQA